MGGSQTLISMEVGFQGTNSWAPSSGGGNFVGGQSVI